MRGRAGGGPAADSRARAAALYDATSAARYRAHDGQFAAESATLAIARWLGDVSARCGRDLTVLDLGCGTGRYFWALQGVRDLVGLDASAAMLAEARHPFEAHRISARRTLLVEGDLLHCAFRQRSFDLVYSVGVLAEHVPLTRELVESVARWLRPGGRFAFTAVRPDSPTVPQTWTRRAARAAASVAPAPARRAIGRRLLAGGRYADAPFLRELLEPGFAIEMLEPFESDVRHLHSRVVARRKSA